LKQSHGTSTVIDIATLLNHTCGQMGT
jgi:hypothetical protein